MRPYSRSFLHIFFTHLPIKMKILWDTYYGSVQNVSKCVICCIIKPFRYQIHIYYIWCTENKAVIISNFHYMIFVAWRTAGIYIIAIFICKKQCYQSNSPITLFSLCLVSFYANESNKNMSREVERVCNHNCAKEHKKNCFIEWVFTFMAAGNQR